MILVGPRRNGDAHDAQAITELEDIARLSMEVVSLHARGDGSEQLAQREPSLDADPFARRWTGPCVHSRDRGGGGGRGGGGRGGGGGGGRGGGGEERLRHALTPTAYAVSPAEAAAALVLPALPGRAAPGGRQACRAPINRPVRVPTQRSSFRAGRSRSCSPTSRARPGSWPSSGMTPTPGSFSTIGGSSARDRGAGRGRGRHPGRRVLRGVPRTRPMRSAADPRRAARHGDAPVARPPRRSGSGWSIHPARPRLEGRGYVGIEVHRAARIVAAAHGGQVLPLRGGASTLTARTSCPTGSRLRRARRASAQGPRPDRTPLPASRTPDLIRGVPPAADRSTIGRTTCPCRPSAFVGREVELAAIEAQLATNAVRLITLIGPGGSGKTRLALRAAADQVERLNDRVFFVDLAAGTDTESALAAIARAIGFTQTRAAATRRAQAWVPRPARPPGPRDFEYRTRCADVRLLRKRRPDVDPRDLLPVGGNRIARSRSTARRQRRDEVRGRPNVSTDVTGTELHYLADTLFDLQT